MARTISLLMMICCIVAQPLLVRSEELQATEVMNGRLATVEPLNRRVTVVPDGGVDLVELFVAADGEVQQDGQRMTLSDLVIQVGRRVAVHYRLEGDRRIASRLIVDPR